MPLAFDPATVDWNLLRAFVAVVEHGSLTRAAERLGSSQPTLSRQIAALEALAGLPLFERAARRVQPTEAGRALAEPARRMLAAAQAMAQVASGQGKGLSGTVRITASEVVSTHVLPPILAALARAHPQIEVELVASDRLDNLLEREADIAVRMVRPAQGALISRHLCDWPLGFYAHRDYLAAAGPVSEATLARHRWIGFDQSTQMIDGFRAAGIAIDRHFFGLRCDHQLVGFAAIEAGVGIGITTQVLAARRPALVRVLPRLTLPVLPVWLTAHRELRASVRLKTVWQALADGLLAFDRPARRPRTRP